MDKTDYIKTLLEMPTVVNNVHESVYRAYHILRFVEWLLENGTPADVTIALMREAKRLPNKKV